MSVSLVAPRHGISGSQTFTWRRLMKKGALTAATAGEEGASVRVPRARAFSDQSAS